jgi:hypothetical protein
LNKARGKIRDYETQTKNFKNMKLKIFQVTNAVPQLIALNQVKGFNAKIAYNISKTFKSIVEEAQAYEKVRIAKLEELCEKNAKGEAKKEKDGSYKLSDENKKIFQDEIRVLAEQEVEIYCTPISISEISHITGLSSDVFAVLDWLFVE